MDYCNSKKTNQVFVSQGCDEILWPKSKHNNSQAQCLQRHAVGANLGNSAHLLDAANYFQVHK